MTTEQLYLAIGVPVLFNAALSVALALFINANVNARFEGMQARFDDKFEGINKRFDDMRDLWRAELRRVEEVLDAA